MQNKNFPETIFPFLLETLLTFLGLHGPTIRGLYSGQIWLVDELQKTALECNRGLYIHNTRTRHGYKMSTKPTLQQLKNVFLT